MEKLKIELPSKLVSKLQQKQLLINQLGMEMRQLLDGFLLGKGYDINDDKLKVIVSPDFKYIEIEEDDDKNN